MLLKAFNHFRCLNGLNMTFQQRHAVRSVVTQFRSGASKLALFEPRSTRQAPTSIEGLCPFLVPIEFFRETSFCGPTCPFFGGISLMVFKNFYE